MAGFGCPPRRLPGWLLQRSVKRTTFEKSLQWLRRPARFVDRFLRPRLAIPVQGPAVRDPAGLCLLVALSMPVLEFIPFSATLAGAALTACALALIACDGLMAVLDMTFIAAMDRGGGRWPVEDKSQWAQAGSTGIRERAWRL